MAKNSFRLQSNAGQLAFFSAVREFWRAGLNSSQILNVVLERSDYLVGIKNPRRIVKRALRIVKAAAAKENLETTEVARIARVEYIEQQRFVYSRAASDHDWPSAIRASGNIARARGANVESEAQRVLEDVLMPRDILRALNRAACQVDAKMVRDNKFLGSQAYLRDRRDAQKLLATPSGDNGGGS